MLLSNSAVRNGALPLLPDVVSKPNTPQGHVTKPQGTGIALVPQRQQLGSVTLLLLCPRNKPVLCAPILLLHPLLHPRWPHGVAVIGLYL